MVEERYTLQMNLDPRRYLRLVMADDLDSGGYTGKSCFTLWHPHFEPVILNPRNRMVTNHGSWRLLSKSLRQGDLKSAAFLNSVIESVSAGEHIQDRPLPGQGDAQEPDGDNVLAMRYLKDSNSRYIYNIQITVAETEGGKPLSHEEVPH